MVVNFSIVPMDKGGSLSPYVAQVVKLVEDSGLDYHLHAMGTVVEGDWDEVFGLVRLCHEKMRSGSTRVITTVQVDDREGAVNRLEGKRKSVETKIGHPLL